MLLLTFSFCSEAIKHDFFFNVTMYKKLGQFLVDLAPTKTPSSLNLS